MIGASTGLFGAVWAQAEVRKALRTAGANVLEDALSVELADHAFAAAGTLADPRVATALSELVLRLVEHAQIRLPEDAGGGDRLAASK